jgi:glutamate--cysteine ligase
LPPLHAGWPTRRKSRHFQSYEEVAKKFAKLLGMDAWLINPMQGHCGQVDFDSASGLDCVKSNVDAMLTKVRRKYKEYGITERPFVVVKADNAGGTGILTVRDAKELDDQERMRRGRAGLVHPGEALTEVIIQEGVPTFERIHDAVAEPVVMMIDRYVVGGFYRVHADRGVDQSLCAPGSQYVPLAFAGSSQLPRPGQKPGASAPNRFYLYGVIARLAMLAAAYELEATDPDAESYD